MEVDSYAAVAPAKSRKPSAVLADITASASAAPTAKGKKEKTVEQIYQKKTQLEHILLRPDSYIGSIARHSGAMWVLGEGPHIENKSITYVPGLYKIFDEILVNAADNKQRDTKGMNSLKVTIDAETNTISVWNNGRGVPIVLHGEHHVYVPELIFGHLLTSSNYDDDEKKVTGGRNGYGAKLANIFSTRFTIETADGSKLQRYKQVFTKNMTEKGEPVISAYSGPDYTCVTFQPDLKRFGMDELEEDTVALLSKRVFDMAGILGKSVAVYLNGTRVPVATFAEYVTLYRVGDEPVAGAGAAVTDSPRIWEKISDRWEVCLTLSDGVFNQVSFVNAICTYKGGQHVSYIADQIAEAVAEAANKKNKGVAVKPAHVRNYMCLFLNCLIENPAFDSQTKESLTTRPKDFGSSPVLSEKFIKNVLASGIVERVQSWAKYKATTELQRASGGKRSTRFVGIPKLDDANMAGGAKGVDCTLILTEGDSAKSLAIAGLSIVGRDYYGVFPLKGKLLNVREAGHKQIMANMEIQNIVTILGLQYGKVYESAKGLRYGHLMIMADQDHDGSHIKGLIINFLHHFWPSLLAIPGFLREFITPIVKAIKGAKSRSFFTIPEYCAWKDEVAGSMGAHASKGTLKGWAIKYYKGLGTSTAQEAKDYFSAIARHQIDFAMDDPTATGYNAHDLIDLAFSKKRADDRKDWLKAYEPGTHVDYDTDTMLVSEFIQKELILFSMADNVRSIPSVVDGFKPAQRKVLFACLKRNLKTDIKVAQLAGYVSEHAAYHHGEVSLTSTIVGMAQTFTGSNNINLLVPSGQFGTRIMGGKDAASPRYVFTRLVAVARAIFHPDDDALLQYLDDDGQSIEPLWYMPIIPMVLVNGAEGIGTGWSTSIPNHNPRDVIAAVRARIEGTAAPVLEPWYRGFTGTITRKDATSFVATGVACVDESGETLTVSELPVRKWTQDYKQLLVTMITGETSKDADEKKAGGKKTATAAAKAKAVTKAAAKPKAASKAAAAAGGAGDGGKKPRSKPVVKATAKASKAVVDEDEEEEEDITVSDDDGDVSFIESDVEEEDDEEDFDEAVAKPKSKGKKEVSPLVPVGEPLVKEFAENHTDTKVSFTIKVAPACAKLLAACKGAGPDSITPAVRKVFKLDTTLNTSNMHLFDADGVIKRYASAAAIVDEFYGLRLEWYGKRKEHLLAKLCEEKDRLANRARFISAVISGELVISNRKKASILGELHDAGYKGFEAAVGDAGGDGDESGDESGGVGAPGSAVPLALLSRRYNYLLSMPLWSLTEEKVRVLRKELEDKEGQYAALKGTSLTDVWLRDLSALEAALDDFDSDVADEERASDKATADFAKTKKAAGGKGGKATAARGGKTAAGAKKQRASKHAGGGSEDDDDDDVISDEEEEEEDSDFEVKPKSKGGKVAVGGAGVTAPTKARTATTVTVGKTKPVAATAAARTAAPVAKAAVAKPRVSEPDAAVSSFMSELGLDDLGLGGLDIDFKSFGLSAATTSLVLPVDAAGAGKKRPKSDERAVPKSKATAAVSGDAGAFTMASPLKGSPEAKKRAPKATKASSEGVAAAKPTAVGKVKAAAVVTKKPVVSKKAADSDDDSDDIIVSKVPAAKGKAGGKAAATATARPKRAAATVSKKLYAASDASSSDDASGSESEAEWDEGDDSDF